MKKTPSNKFRKFQLATTTIAPLDERQLANVDGGGTPRPGRDRTQAGCPVNNC